MHVSRSTHTHTNTLTFARHHFIFFVFIFVLPFLTIRSSMHANNEKRPHEQSRYSSLTLIFMFVLCVYIAQYNLYSLSRHTKSSGSNSNSNNIGPNCVYKYRNRQRKYNDIYLIRECGERSCQFADLSFNMGNARHLYRGSDRHTGTNGVTLE